MTGAIPLFGGIPGGPERLVILLIAILLFGANKIPKLARSSGEAIGEFQKGREEVEQELQQMQEGETKSADDTSATAAEATEETAESTTAETESASAGSSGGSSE
jgi:sec-independent protein translocase protein TatA